MRAKRKNEPNRGEGGFHMPIFLSELPTEHKLLSVAFISIGNSDGK
jgi:hypothetical protein